MTLPIALVTGGAGFIGSHMVDLLVQEGFSVRVIDNLVGGRESNLLSHLSNQSVTLDRRDIRALLPSDSIFKDVKYLFHFAGIGDIVPSIDNPSEYLSVNAQGTVQVLEGARHAKIAKLVYAASSSCYGDTPPLPTSELAPIQCRYPYALSKYVGELEVMHWHRTYGLPANSIRIFNAYGPRSRTSGAYGAVFGVFLKQKIAGAPFTVVGDGTQTRDFVFVLDLVRAFYLAASCPVVGEVFNVGAGNPQSVNTLVSLLKAPGQVHLPKRPGEPDCTWADIRKVSQVLGWSPKVSFEEGVAVMLQNIDYWKDAPLWNPESIATATAGWFQAFGSAQSEF